MVLCWPLLFNFYICMAPGYILAILDVISCSKLANVDVERHLLGIFIRLIWTLSYLFRSGCQVFFCSLTCILLTSSCLLHLRNFWGNDGSILPHPAHQGAMPTYAVIFKFWSINSYCFLPDDMFHPAKSLAQ